MHNVQGGAGQDRTGNNKKKTNCQNLHESPRGLGVHLSLYPMKCLNPESLRIFLPLISLRDLDICLGAQLTEYSHLQELRFW